MFIHDWNGKSITQLTSDTKIAKFDIPAGYVNVTQMCGACGKLWAVLVSRAYQVLEEARLRV